VLHGVVREAVAAREADLMEDFAVRGVLREVPAVHGADLLAALAARREVLHGVAREVPAAHDAHMFAAWFRMRVPHAGRVAPSALCHADVHQTALFGKLL
jgi:hypothetical protein